MGSRSIAATLEIYKRQFREESYQVAKKKRQQRGALDHKEKKNPKVLTLHGLQSH